MLRALSVTESSELKVTWYIFWKTSKAIEDIPWHSLTTEKTVTKFKKLWHLKKHLKKSSGGVTLVMFQVFIPERY